GSVGCDVEGSFVVAEELVAVWAGPQVAAGVEDEVGPRAVGLEPVVAAAQGCDVAGAGRAAAGSGDDVVVVAGMLGGVVGVVWGGRGGSVGRVGCTRGTHRCGPGWRPVRRSSR